jgi:hypothetical protein
MLSSRGGCFNQGIDADGGRAQHMRKLFAVTAPRACFELSGQSSHGVLARALVRALLGEQFQ